VLTAGFLHLVHLLEHGPQVGARLADRSQRFLALLAHLLAPLDHAALAELLGILPQRLLPGVELELALQAGEILHVVTHAMLHATAGAAALGAHGESRAAGAERQNQCRQRERGVRNFDFMVNSLKVRWIDRDSKQFLRLPFAMEPFCLWRSLQTISSAVVRLIANCFCLSARRCWRHRMISIAQLAKTMRKILLVDDDAELRRLLATYLGRHGFDTLLLPDTRQLDAFLERYQPQLLVLDLMLPGEDGLAACRRLRARGETRPVIMLTARDEPVDRVIGLEMGADDYLGKPFDPRELVARIEAVLRRGTRPPAGAGSRGRGDPLRRLAI
jgi:CheY-like chemotaxis protein